MGNYVFVSANFLSVMALFNNLRVPLNYKLALLIFPCIT